MKEPGFDGLRIAASSAVAAVLAVGLAAVFLHQSRSASHVGPTSAALSDGFSELAGLCLGLGAGSVLAAAIVRRGSPFAAGVIAGAVGFLVGAVPYEWLTAPSDVGTSDVLGWLVIVFVPASVLVIAGAGLAALVRTRHG